MTSAPSGQRRLAGPPPPARPEPAARPGTGEAAGEAAGEAGVIAWPGLPGRPGRPEEELVRALYRDHAGALYAYVLRLVGGDRYQAEDVVQETLLRAWRSADRLDPAARSLRPWLVTVARRIVIDGHRSRRARPPETSPALLEQLPAEDELDRTLRLMTISDALDDLTEAHRRVLVETYFKGRTVNEAAAELGVPPGTVRSRVFYALRALRLALEERGVTTL